jgi:hypothetical protein
MVPWHSEDHIGEGIMTIAVLTRLRETREERARRRTLWRELSAYTTAEELDEIEAAVARSQGAGTDPETQEIRRFLAARRTMFQRA